MVANRSLRLLHAQPQQLLAADAGHILQLPQALCRQKKCCEHEMMVGLSGPKSMLMEDFIRTPLICVSLNVR